MSSFLSVLTKRFCLSAAVKKILVRFVSTRTTSSELSVTSSSGFFGVGLGWATGSTARAAPFCASEPREKLAACAIPINSRIAQT